MSQIQSCQFVGAARIATYTLLVLSFGLIVLGKPSLPRGVKLNEHKGREQKAVETAKSMGSCHILYYLYEYPIYNGTTYIQILS